MPRGEQDAGLPTTPPREQAPIPKPDGQANAVTKARIGLLPTLSIASYQPDPNKVEAALGMNAQATEVPLGDGSDDVRFRQPKFGG